jgi:hypothetical protein
MSIIVLKSSVSEFQLLAAKYLMDFNPYLVVFGLDKANISAIYLSSCEKLMARACACMWE